MHIQKLFAATALAVCISFSPLPAMAEEIVIKFSHVTAASGNPKGEAAEEFASRVNKELAGKVRVEVYPSSQLYDDNKVLEAMILGDVQMAAPSLSKFENYTHKFRIFDLPFLFEDINAVNRFQASIHGQDLLKSMEKEGFLGLAYWHNGMKQMSANKPLRLPQDANGLKFRIQTSDVLEAQFRAIGANPQKMAFSEVYGALQQGVVDGQENTWSNIYTKKFHEVQDGITETNHGVLDYLVVTDALFWNDLPTDIRSQLEQILAEVTAKWNGQSEEINLVNKNKVMGAGVEVRSLSADEREAWVAVMKPVWNQFADDIGHDLMEAALKSNMAN